MNARSAATAATLGAAYAAIVVVQGPSGFTIPQVRIADALLPLSVIFGLPAVLGITLGTFASNLLSPFGPNILDILGGSLANLLATYAAWKIGQNFRSKGSWVFALFIQVLIITFVVGTYLPTVLSLPEEPLPGIKLPAIVYSWLLVFTGSVIAVMVVGYAVLKGVARALRFEERYW